MIPKVGPAKRGPAVEAAQIANASRRDDDGMTLFEYPD